MSGPSIKSIRGVPISGGLREVRGLICVCQYPSSPVPRGRCNPSERQAASAASISSVTLRLSEIGASPATLSDCIRVSRASFSAVSLAR